MNFNAPFPTKQWCPKSMREYLCAQSTFAPDAYTQLVFQQLIDALDTHRPLGPDGKHGNRHTETCGCDNSSRPTPGGDDCV